MLIERGQAYRPRIRRLEDRVLLNATPEAAVVDLPAEELINDDFSFAVTFDNTASSTDPLGTGYGPFVDVTVEPGVEINSVTYLGTAVTSQTVGTWDGSNWVDGNGAVVSAHPFGGGMALPQGTEIGQTWVNVLAPFGSYGPDQPVIRLDFKATLAQSPNGIDPGAVPGDPIDITARGGFRFGLDELQNPSTDPPIQQGSTSTDAITPIVMRLEKAVQLAEGETAQGPNFPFTYTISVDVATNITVTDIDVQDLLPTNLFFLNATTNVAATAVTAPGVGGTPQGVPGADTVTTAEWSFATVTGRTGDGDIVITLSAYAPERDASGALIINPLNPHVAIATNNATVDALYQGNPVDAATGGDLQDSIDIAIRPFTVLKTVSVEGGGPPVPGSYLRFQVTIDVSDYQAFSAAILNDLLSDGLTFDTTDNGVLEHTPVLQLVQNGQTTFIDLQRLVPPSQQTEVTSAFQANGTETLTFFISNALSNSGHDSRLVGDLFAGDAQQGATTLTLVYFARIDETFRQAGRGPVVVNDVLSNSISMTANSALPGGGAADPDGSQSSVTVPQPQGQKSIYAVNGVLGNPGTVSPGDTVTYRIRIAVASSDVDDLIITDYLPLPVYDVDANGSGFVFVDTQGGVPTAFTIIRGPDDTLTGGGRTAGVPIVATLGANNAIQLDFESFDEDASIGGIIDILYTVVATDQPFADGLLLVNQAVVQTGDSQSTLVLEQDFVNAIILRQPVLSLTKGVVATNATGAVDNSLAFNPSTVAPSKLTFLVGTPGFSTSAPLTSADLIANPIVSDLSGIDAGDTVKFAIVIQNTGGQDAFDLLIRDQLPPGFDIPPGAALQLDVRYGDGTPVAAFSGNLFGPGGLSIADGPGTGSIAADGSNDGRNIIIITYQLVATDSIDPGITVQNAAELLSYAAIENGTDFTENVDGQFTDQVALTTQGIAAAKRLTATDQTFTSGNDLAIGEVATFQITVTFPDGDTSATVSDTLPTGMVLVGSPVLRLTFVNGSGQTVTFDGTVAQNGTTLANGSVLTYSYVNNVLTFDFSNVVANAAPGTTLSGQSFVIEYQVRASDDPALQAGVTVSNSAILDTPTTAPTAPAVVPVDIVEPNLSIIKEFLPDVAQGGQLIQMRLTVQNSSASSSTTSFGLQMSDDDLPLGWFTSLVLTSKTGTGAVNTALVDVTISQAGGFWVITVADNNPNFAIAPGEKLILNFAMRVDPAIVTGSTLDNVAVIPDGGYTSLPGIDPNERLFEQVTGQDRLTILAPQITKTLVNTSYGGTEYLTPGQPGYVADTNPDVLVGEILIYEIRVPIPRGTSQNVVVYDDTDFLNVLGAQGIIEILKVDSYGVGADLQLSTPPAFQLLDTDGDGVVNRLRFEFGTIVNNATGVVSDEETIVITVRAQVLNVPETDEGDVHLNGTAVTFSVGDVPNFAVPDTNVTVTVTEPAIDVVKTLATPDSTTDAGDVVTYTLTIRHNPSSTADGFELDLIDQLPPGTILVANSVTITAGAPAFGLDPLQLSDITLDLVNNRVLVSGFDLGLNQVVTITYQATVAPDVVAGQVLTNTVDLTYKSLPDVDAVDNEDPSLAKDVVGAQSQRRDGSDGGPRTDELRLNNYAFTTTATLTIAQPGPIIKTSDKTTYTIGEQIIYTITIPVIEGLTENPFLTDFLPAGFVFVPGSGIAVDASGNALVIDGASTLTQTLTLDLANFTTVADNDPNNDFIRVSFRVQVLNVVDNVNDAVKVNTATFTSDHSPDRTDTVSVRIVEPKLSIGKTNDATGPVDAGDIVTYSVTVAHTISSKATAYEFAFRDPTPAGQRVIGIVSARINGVDVTGQIGFDATGVFSLAGANLDIPLGSTLTVVYQVEMLDSVGPGQTLTNTVTGDWSSLDGQVNPGAVDGERIGTPVPDANSYITSAQSTIETARTFEIDKSVVGPDIQFTIGERVDYVIDLKVFEGTLRNVIIADVMVPGLELDVSTLAVVNSGFAGGTVSIRNVQVTTNVLGYTILTFELDNDASTAGSQIVNPGDPAGNTFPNDTIRIAYQAIVRNVLTNQQGEFLPNGVGARADDVDDALGVALVEIVEPDLVIGKTNDATGPVDAGDIVTYSITVGHTASSTATAYEFAFRDPTPVGQRVIGIVSATINGLDVTGQIGFDATGIFSLAGADLDIPLGSVLTIVYQVEMLDSVGPGQTLTNTVTGDWSSLDGQVNPGAENGERIGTPAPDANDYITSAQSTIETSATFEIDKSVVGPDIQFSIGERIDYVIDLKVFEGTLHNVIIADVLVAGLEIDISTLSVVNNGFAGGTVSIRNVQVTTNAAGETILTFELDNDPTTAGSQVINPGDPAGNTAANDTIRISYQAIVRNIFANQENVVLPNVAFARADDVIDASDFAFVEVVEPHLTIDKRQISSPTTIDAGDPVEFEVIMTNDGLSTAYDVTLVDTVTPNAVFGIAVAFDSAGNVVGSFSISPNGHVLTGTGFTIAPGDFVRVVYTIVAADTLEPGDQIANGVDVRWTSTPGANPNERTGADGPGPDDSVLNNYVARDAEIVQTGRGAGAVTIDKVVFDTSIVETRNTNVAVGEIVTFRLRIHLEEGTTVGLHLRDFLPTGQRYLPGSVVVVAGNSGATLNFDPASVSVTAGNELIIPLGTVVNPGDNLPFNDYVDVFYTVVIVDDPTNVTTGAVLPNTVILTGNRVGATDSADVTVVEPKLSVDKNVSTAFVAIGDRADYTITVAHDPTSAIDAFDVVVSDPFDNPNMVLDPASITAVIVNGAGLPAPIIELVGTGFRVTVPDLPVGATLQISFSAIAQNTATVNGQTVVNVATIDYDTVPGTDAPDEQRDYTDTDDAAITIAGPDLQVLKDASTLIVRPGDLFSYTIQVLNKGAPGLDAGAIEQARNVVLTDTLPRDLTLHAVSVDGVSVPFSLDPVTRQFSVNLGTMNPEQVRLVTLTVSVEDPLSPVFNGGADRFLLVNTATATMDQPEPTPLDNTDTATVTALADPDLVVTKTNAIEETGGSETVTFTITAKNVGHRVAAGVEIVDMVDTRVFDFVSASDGGTFDAATGRVIWQFNTLSPTDGDRILTLVLKVKSGLPANLDETTNVVVIGDNGYGGDDPTPDNNRDTHTDRLIYPDLVVTKTNNVEEVMPGDIVTYQITVSNVGAFLADGVRVTDLPDSRLFRFISASDGGVYDAGTGRIVWNLGTLQAGSTPRVLTLTMEVLFPPSLAIENAVNLVAITSDGTRGQDADVSNNVDIDTDTLNATIDPAEIRALFEPDEPFFEEEEDDILYISPMLTGRAAVGSYVSVVLIGPDGQRMELGSTQTPASGDWMISLPDMHGKGPISAIVTTAPPVMTSLGALDANNVFFNPGGDSPIGFQRRYDLFSVTDNDSYTALQAQIAASEEPLALATRRFVNFNKVGATGVSLY